MLEICIVIILQILFQLSEDHKFISCFHKKSSSSVKTENELCKNNLAIRRLKECPRGQFGVTLFLKTDVTYVPRTRCVAYLV